MKRLTFILFILVCEVGWAQNLAPNPSFEQIDTCPYTNGQIEIAEPWTGVYGGGGTCLFHECGTNGWTVPVNPYGGEYARTGQSYIGYQMWAYSSLYQGQFGGVELISPLIAGKKYRVEFYISLMDSVWYAIKNVGVYFSQSQPPANIATLLSYEPQVRYTGSEYLSNKVGWTKIEGSFYANGGEQFITIGNFDGQPNSDTLLLPDGGMPPPGMGPTYWWSANYFIDDVLVELDTTVGIEEQEQMKFEVYPNPTKESIVIETEFREQTMVNLFDVMGREVLTTALAGSKTTIDVSRFAAGVYTAVLLRDDVAVGRRKILVE